MRRTCVFLIGLLLLAGASHAQELPRAEDVSSLDGIINAYYEVVSAAPGERRDWARDRSLHHPDAHVTIIGQNSDGEPVARVMSLADYHDSSGEVSEAGFFEYEIYRVVERYGNTAHVWSTYEWKNTEDGPVGGRGINSIQLYWTEGRWWITAWMFDNTLSGDDIPAKYLPQG